MPVMTPPQFKFAYLQPLFADVESLRGEAAYQQLPAAQPSSSLAADDAPLGTYSASTLIRASFTAGVAHADALRRIVLHGEVDPTSPWTLMRGALENFATAAWLLGGNDRTERRHRSLRLWREDMRNRAQHEEDTDHVPGPGGKTGRERVQEIESLAVSLGIPRQTRQAGSWETDSGGRRRHRPGASAGHRRLAGRVRIRPRPLLAQPSRLPAARRRTRGLRPLPDGAGHR
jgi:hypothetical protein